MHHRYTSFRALIYYLYTDSITFAPLASTYHVARDHAAQQGVDFPFTSRRAYLFGNIPPAVLQAMTMPGGAPGPCSAKAIYRLADKIGLPELKDRAYDHIVKSLTVQNVPRLFLCGSGWFTELTGRVCRRSRTRCLGRSVRGSRRSSASRLRSFSRSGCVTHSLPSPASSRSDDSLPQNEVRESSSLKKVFQFGLRHVGRFPGFEEVMVRM